MGQRIETDAPLEQRIYIVRGRYYKEGNEVKPAPYYDVEKMQYYYIRSK